MADATGGLFEGIQFLSFVFKIVNVLNQSHFFVARHTLSARFRGSVVQHLSLRHIERRARSRAARDVQTLNSDLIINRNGSAEFSWEATRQTRTSDDHTGEAPGAGVYG
jgi:hypothetical protein